MGAGINQGPAVMSGGKVFVALVVLSVAVALKLQPVPDRLDTINNLQVQQDANANSTIQVAFDPLGPVEIISQNLEVTGRIYQSCTAGDLNARWIEQSSSKSAPNQHCYMAFLVERTWFQARRACESVGGYLVTITSEDEMNFIWKKFGPLFTETWKGPWIGFSDASKEGDWAWVTGESGVVGQDSVYANWYVGEPDDCCGGQDCASIAGGHWGYKWNDNKCHFLLPSICERDF